MEDNIADITALVKATDDETISLWSEQKKDEFVKLFKDRARVSAAILNEMAIDVLEEATQKRYVNRRAISSLQLTNRSDQFDPMPGGYSHYRTNTIGGRPSDEIFGIAKKRAKKILSELPALRDAVNVIDPDTAAKLDEADKFKSQLESLHKRLSDLSEPIKMSELDQSMTIGAFRKHVKDVEDERGRITLEVKRLGREHNELEAVVAKKLYSGVPGLSEAIIATIKSLLERVTALDVMSRRVEEQVKFGDSKAALKLLSHFEKDEVDVSASTHQQIKDAVAKLGLSKKPVKKLAAKDEA